MKILATAAALLCIGLSAAPIGSADASEVLYDGSGFLRGQQSFSDTFSVDGPGLLTVTLTDMDWPAPLASLDLLVATPSGPLGPEVGPGTSSYQLTAGGDITAQWFGTAQGALDTGAYGINIVFTPSAVPLPATLLLLFSGLGLMMWQAGRRPRPTAAADR